MHQPPLPPDDEMFAAFTARDTRYDGIFLTGVRTTGIFCRPSCPARKPERRNVEFFGSAKEALAGGYRPCKRCRPLEAPGSTPPAIAALLREVEGAPTVRLRDADLRTRGLDPVAVRRWFRAQHGMSFHAYQRGVRLAGALGRLAAGDPVTHTAFGSGYESQSGFDEAVRRLTGRTAARSRDAALVHLTRITTPLGPMLLGATAEAVCLLEFADRRMLETQLRRLEQRLGCAFVPGGNAVSRAMESELAGYFAGGLREFATPLATPGTDFQRRVWAGLREIPYGATRSYAEQARAIGAPSAVRAVARANGDNRIAIVIPCHRVVGADGTLTGYGGGLWRKRWLLHHEGAREGRAAAALGGGSSRLSSPLSS